MLDIYEKFIVFIVVNYEELKYFVGEYGLSWVEIKFNFVVIYYEDLFKKEKIIFYVGLIKIV